MDACACDLMRPAMYGAYHHITVSGKEDAPCDHKYDVVGALCENNDKFAVDRMLPKINRGDLLVIHDTRRPRPRHGLQLQRQAPLRRAAAGKRCRGADPESRDPGGLFRHLGVVISRKAASYQSAGLRLSLLRQLRKQPKGACRL